MIAWLTLKLRLVYFHIENWNEIPPHRNNDYYGDHSNSSVLKAMADGPKLPARTFDAEAPQNSTISVRTNF